MGQVCLIHPNLGHNPVKTILQKNWFGSFVNNYYQQIFFIRDTPCFFEQALIRLWYSAI